MVKNPPANAEDVGSTPGSGRSPGEGNGNWLSYSCLEKSHGQRSLAGYSPWGHERSDTTVHNTHTLKALVGERGLCAQHWVKRG